MYMLFKRWYSINDARSNVFVDLHLAEFSFQYFHFFLGAFPFEVAFARPASIALAAMARHDNQVPRSLQLEGLCFGSRSLISGFFLLSLFHMRAFL